MNLYFQLLKEIKTNICKEDIGNVSQKIGCIHLLKQKKFSMYFQMIEISMKQKCPVNAKYVDTIYP